MTYSAGMPILYFFGALNFIILYYLDKFFLFRVCKKPINFDGAMANLVRSVLMFAPILHNIFAIIVYGNEKIFNDNAKG